MNEVKQDAESEGAADYQRRADDVDSGYQRASWSWPFAGADEAYIDAVGVDVICDRLGLPRARWEDVSDVWCASFRRGYEAANAEAK